MTRTASFAPFSATDPSRLPEVVRPADAGRPPGPQRLAESIPARARAVLRLLERLEHGRLMLVTPGGATLVFGAGEPHATIRLANWDVCAATMSRGDIGFAETWIARDWHTDSLADLLSLVVANRNIVERAVYGNGWGQWLYRLRHALRRNTRSGSRRNIHAHYDLGNRFYERWLDPSMTYSSALYDGDRTRTLEQAQQAKYRRILDVLALPAGSRILEIGCGWGGFAEMAARDGLSVTGLTLSTEQHAWARQRMVQSRLADRASFLLQDYRDEQARYDAIVSIEMFEAVGEAYWPTYFETLRRCLKPGARAVVQSITIDDALFERYRRGTDFIQQYIFPGGMLPSPRGFEQAARAAGLRVTEGFAFGPDYARTLAEWREAFVAQAPAILAQGFDDRFMRTWEFYLAYCEAGFAHGNTDVYQFTLQAD